MAWRKTNSLAEDKELAETARIIKGLGNCNPILVNINPQLRIFYPKSKNRANPYNSVDLLGKCHKKGSLRSFITTLIAFKYFNYR